MTRTGADHRLAEGGAIDRSKRLAFHFEGQPYFGFAGDTLASALLANGVRLVGRSFKYHRPRGILAAGTEECNALVQLGQGACSTPNMRATEIDLYDGLTARVVNCWPNARFDIGAVNQLFARFLAAGFYYKTFMWPSWRLYEGVIRRAAGLGRVARGADPDRYEQRFAHCDVLVVGAGPAGLSAARAAACGGARVFLVEQDRELGGQLRWDGGQIDDLGGGEWADKCAAELRTMEQARILTRTTVVGYFDHNALTMVEKVGQDDPDAGAFSPRYRLWQVRAKRVILATGAIERPLVFPGNDRLGVMLAAAVRQYVRRYAVRPGHAAVVFTNNDEAYRTAFAYQAAGGVVRAIVDIRSAVSPDVTAPLETAGISVLKGAAVIATDGAKALTHATVRLATGRTVRLACDLLACSGGANPTVHLFSQSGGQIGYDPERVMFRPQRSVQAERSVGAANGTLTLTQALAEGHTAGIEASALVGFASELAAPSVLSEHRATSIEACWNIDSGRGKGFVDLQNDVTAADVQLAARENFVSVEHLKRYTTLGMASDQGKTSNVNALAIMSQLTDRSIGETGSTKFRFPYTPVPLGAFAGRRRQDLFRPMRRLPLHDWHLAQNAVLEDFGGWLRPAAYLRPSEPRHAAEQREALAVRQGVALFDGSPLGKIEVRGRDAGRLLDFIYANKVSTLKVGKLRYGLLLNEAGVVMDDGVCARLGDDHFLVGASSSGAERVADWIEEWLQCEFPHYDVLVAPVTTQWAVITLTGPQARAVLDAASVDFALGAQDFPHMSFRVGRVAGVAARVFRVSFTGEVSFEINVAAEDAARVWETLFQLGQAYQIQPIGLDALNLLRVEKGYLHLGADTDGTTTALNIGWEHVLKREQDFIGKRSLSLSANCSRGGLQLVGLTAEGDAVLPIGAHAVTAQVPRRSEGFVTSSVKSPILGRGVALAMIRDGRERLGQVLKVEAGGKTYAATIVAPGAYDKEGLRLNA